MSTVHCELSSIYIQMFVWNIIMSVPCSNVDNNMCVVLLKFDQKNQIFIDSSEEGKFLNSCDKIKIRCQKTTTATISRRNTL